MIPDLFKDAKSQYTYDERSKTYSVMVMLDNRPRIITLRLGQDFSEISVSDKRGKVLEVLRQEDGKGITFRKVS